MAEPRSDIRQAVRRLTRAVHQDAVTVEVFRKDLFLVMAAIHSRASIAEVEAPELHPQQR